MVSLTGGWQESPQSIYLHTQDVLGRHSVPAWANSPGYQWGFFLIKGWIYNCSGNINISGHHLAPYFVTSFTWYVTSAGVIELFTIVFAQVGKH